jgi:acyl-CoA thioesterase
MGYEWDQQVAVTEQRPGRYAAELAPGWVVGGGVNGGYQLGVLGNAISSALPGKPDPITLSAYFLSPGAPGPAQIDVDIRREGRTVATVAADLVQDGTTRIAALATYGDLGQWPDDVRTTAPEIDLPPRDKCVPNTLAPAEFRKTAPLLDRFEMLFHPDHVGWAVGTPSGEGVISAWFRLIDGRDPDPLELLMVVDALPPVTFELGRIGWAPTLELTAHVRARPAPGWLKVRHQTSNVAGGMFEEDCEVWDSTGRLVAQSRQLALLPR